MEKCHKLDQGFVRYSAALFGSFSSGTDMKIFWQNIVKISEKKQLVL